MLQLLLWLRCWFTNVRIQTKANSLVCIFAKQFAMNYGEQAKFFSALLFCLQRTEDVNESIAKEQNTKIVNIFCAFFNRYIVRSYDN